MVIKAWKTLSTQRPYRFLRVDECELPNGHVIEKLVHEYDPWATVVALTKARELVMIKQYRHAIGKVIWEIPAGVIEMDEDSQIGARRELLEETGFAGGEWIKVGEVSPNPDNHTNKLHIYLALDVEPTGELHLDPDEELEVHLIPIKKALEMARAGELPQAMQLSALFLAQPILAAKGIEPCA